MSTNSKRSPTDAEVLAFCDAVRECDDNLGRASDYEGQQHGPTYAAWSRGHDAFKQHAEAVISWHQHAIFTYRQGLRLNARRTPPNPLAQVAEQR